MPPPCRAPVPPAQDLDIACFRNLDFLRYYEFVAPKTTPIGVSNDLMVSMPRGEFVLRLTQQLAGWQKWFFIKCVCACDRATVRPCNRACAGWRHVHPQAGGRP